MLTQGGILVAFLCEHPLWWESSRLYFGSKLVAQQDTILVLTPSNSGHSVLGTLRPPARVGISKHPWNQPSLQTTVNKVNMGRPFSWSHVTSQTWNYTNKNRCKQTLCNLRVIYSEQQYSTYHCDTPVLRSSRLKSIWSWNRMAIEI